MRRREEASGLEWFLRFKDAGGEGESIMEHRRLRGKERDGI